MLLPKYTGKIIGVAQTLAKYNALPDAIRQELRDTVKLLGAQLEGLVKAKLSGPVLKAPTGHLKGSINTTYKDSGDNFVAIVGTSTDVIPYARIHEYGGIIEAKNAPFLRFKTPDGSWHSVKSVTMPMRSYLRSSLKEMRPTIDKQLKLVPKRVAQRAGFK